MPRNPAYVAASTILLDTEMCFGGEGEADAGGGARGLGRGGGAIPAGLGGDGGGPVRAKNGEGEDD